MRQIFWVGHNRSPSGYVAYDEVLEELEPVMREPGPVVNVTYNVDARSTKIIQDLQERQDILEARLNKYFEQRKSQYS